MIIFRIYFNIIKNVIICNNFFVEHRIASDWITHAGCLFVLLVLNCGNSVLVRGVYVDAEENAGDCVILPVQYLRLYFKREKNKRCASTLNKCYFNRIIHKYFTPNLDYSKYCILLISYITFFNYWFCINSV